MSIFFGALDTKLAETGLIAVFTLIVFFVSSLLNVGAEVTTVSGLFERSLSRYRLKNKRKEKKKIEVKLFRGALKNSLLGIAAVST